MKVSRVSETCQVSEQNSNSRSYSGGGISFRIQPPLESDGDSSADAKQHENANDDSEDKSIANEEGSCCQVVAEIFPIQQNDNTHSDDSLECFLERIRRDRHLDLQL
jgi:hypothetical protein